MSSPPVLPSTLHNCVGAPDVPIYQLLRSAALYQSGAAMRARPAQFRGGPSRDRASGALCGIEVCLVGLSECLAQEVKAFNVRVAVVKPGVIARPAVGQVPRAVPKTGRPH
jgi:NAD(P)-dependent dehydrogenase (short-subunit alcohol dehydrogenase family)